MLMPQYSPMLYDQDGRRKYLTRDERRAFIAAAERAVNPSVQTFCLTLVHSGARISEVLHANARSIDFAVGAIVIESLKKRKPGVFRTVPVPTSLLERLEIVHRVTSLQADPTTETRRLWEWCRTTAWHRVKHVMIDAGVHGPWAVPKGLRHGFGVEGTVDAGIPLNVIQRWLGHSRIETTAIYADAVGREERKLAGRMWPRNSFQRAMDPYDTQGVDR